MNNVPNTPASTCNLLASLKTGSLLRHPVLALQSRDTYRKILTAHGVYITGMDVGHIIAKSNGGADHPDNYMMIGSEWAGPTLEQLVSVYYFIPWVLQHQQLGLLHTLHAMISPA